MVETASCYPTEEQHERWRRRADELGMTMSDFLASMVEAGIKADRGLGGEVAPDEGARELREERNELRDELERARGRIAELEDRAYGGERRAAEEYVAANPGCTWGELVEHLQSTVPDRMSRLTDGLVVDPRGDGDDGFYVSGDEGEPETDGRAGYVGRSGRVVREGGDG